ncbi:MAG: hypothetical protein V2A56_10615 [bacterium]
MDGIYDGKFRTPALIRVLVPIGWVVLGFVLSRLLHTGWNPILLIGAGVVAAALWWVICETILVLFRMQATLRGIDAYFHSYEKVIDSKFQRLETRIVDLTNKQK